MVFALICSCSLLFLSCFLLIAGQEVMPTDIHSTASSSGLEVPDALASASLCSTVRFAGSVQHREETQKKKISHTRFADFRIAHPRKFPAQDRPFCLFCARAVRFRSRQVGIVQLSCLLCATCAFNPLSVNHTRSTGRNPPGRPFMPACRRVYRKLYWLHVQQSVR